MKIFIKKGYLFTFSILILLIGIYRINTGSFQIDLKQFDSKIFPVKKDYFSSFIQENNTINLILGSSLLEDSIIPDSLGAKWFSFTNGGQNIYESYKLLSYYQDSVKIDTIISSFQPFDFPYSYIQNGMDNKPHINGSFHVFGEDSITTLKNGLKQNIQVLKDNTYLNIGDLMKPSQNIVESIGSDADEDLRLVWTKQGFSGRINRPTVKNVRKGKNSISYFRNVKDEPNFFYFDLFDSLAKSLDITVIYLITPKADFYHKGMKKLGNDKKWNAIIQGAKSRDVNLWNYETMDTDQFDFNWFWDETHASYDAAKVFTKLLKNRLHKIN